MKFVFGGIKLWAFYRFFSVSVLKSAVWSDALNRIVANIDILDVIRIKKMQNNTELPEWQ